MDDSAVMSEGLFDAADIGLLNEAIAVYPTLEQAAYLTKLVLPHVTFPIADVSVLIDSLKQCELECRGVKFGKREIFRFMRSSFFPVEDSADLLNKVMLACDIGSRFHHHEAEAHRCLAPDMDVASESSE